jgi:hypothetical protein
MGIYLFERLFDSINQWLSASIMVIKDCKMLVLPPNTPIVSPSLDGLLGQCWWMRFPIVPPETALFPPEMYGSFELVMTMDG